MRFKCNLAVVLAKRKMRMVDLVDATGVAFHTVRRYYHDENIKMIDMDVMAKFCSVLNCQISDLFILE